MALSTSVPPLTLTLAVRPRWVVGTMATISLVLFFAHLVTYLIVGPVPAGGTWGRVAGLFNMDGEVSIPTWWNQILLASSALLLIGIWAAKRSRGQANTDTDRNAKTDAGYWLALALVMLIASIDEGSSVHEIAATPIRNLFGIGAGALANAWVLPAAIVVAALVLVFHRFFLRLPVATRRDFAFALFVYLLGAVGMEVLAAVLVTTGDGISPLPLRVLLGTEELLELLGAVLFIRALFAMLATVQSNVVAGEKQQPKTGT